MVEKTAIPLPFIQEIGSAQLVDGKAISIKGEVTGDEFHFDLADGANPSGASTSNYAIDVSYRGSEGWVVNTKIDGAWQTEDRYPVGEGIGNKREIYIRIEPHQDYFAIFVNGQKLGERNYIMPLDRVSWVYVSGDLNLHQIQFEDNFYMVPFIYDFSGPFEIGKSLYVTGLPDKDANEFYIVLRTDDENVPFILNPRFSVETVVRNTERDGKWMDEERDGDFPFTKDEVFDLVIEVNDDGYSIYVNGNEFQTYYHRAPVSSVKQLEINGDVQISNVDYK